MKNILRRDPRTAPGLSPSIFENHLQSADPFLHDNRILTYSKTLHHGALAPHGVLIGSLAAMLLIHTLGSGLFISKLVAVGLSFIQILL